MSSKGRIAPHDPLRDVLPWLDAALTQAAGGLRAHAVLASGPAGVGQLAFALGLARAWLCEAPLPNGLACGSCPSCRLVMARTHPDLLIGLSQAVQQALEWDSDEEEGADAAEGKGKAKASAEIKVEAVRRIVAFTQQTSARGRAKVVVLFPAEAMNTVSANTLLKTLEEPPGAARFVLATGEPDRLLPTIRSRCQTVQLPLPGADQAADWLAERGVADPAVLLAACGGQPLSALDWARQGLDAAAWRALPQQVLQGRAAAFAGWSVERVIDALQKLCIDALRLSAGASARYFPEWSLPGPTDALRLTQWAADLRQAARHADHPWNAALQVEALVGRARAALQST